MQQSSSYVEAFADTAGIGARLFIFPLFQTEEFHHFVNPPFNRIARQMVKRCLQLQEFPPRQHLIESNILGDVAEFLSGNSRLTDSRNARHFNASAIERTQSTKYPQGCGFACTVGA